MTVGYAPTQTPSNRTLVSATSPTATVCAELQTGRFEDALDLVRFQGSAQ